MFEVWPLQQNVARNLFITILLAVINNCKTLVSKTLVQPRKRLQA